MEGTRLTVVAKEPNGHEFTIRTPGTPERFAQFDEEMAHAFNAFVDLAGSMEAAAWRGGEGAVGAGNSWLDAVTDAALRIFFYWASFAPLSRGSAACGYVVLVACLESCCISLVEPMPKGLQMDWEAILRSDAQDFVAAMKAWVYPARARSRKLEGLPKVEEEVRTARTVLAALL